MLALQKHATASGFLDGVWGSNSRHQDWVASTFTSWATSLALCDFKIGMAMQLRLAWTPAFPTCTSGVLEFQTVPNLHFFSLQITYHHRASQRITVSVHQLRGIWVVSTSGCYARAVCRNFNVQASGWAFFGSSRIKAARLYVILCVTVFRNCQTTLNGCCIISQSHQQCV